MSRSRQAEGGKMDIPGKEPGVGFPASDALVTGVWGVLGPEQER